MIASLDDIRQRTWDFALTIVTMLLLAALGIQSFAGTLYTWWAIRSDPSWQQSGGYTSYVGLMNEIAAPLIVALVVVMGLCVPKRLFARRALLWVSLAMVLAGAAAGAVTRSLVIGLTIYLLLSAGIQLAVVVMTIAGVRAPSYLTEGRLTKTGSGLLHLGFIIFAVVVVALQKSPMMAPVFWLSAALVGAGTVLSFYSDLFARKRTKPAEDGAEDDLAARTEHGSERDAEDDAPTDAEVTDIAGANTPRQDRDEIDSADTNS